MCDDVESDPLNHSPSHSLVRHTQQMAMQMQSQFIPWAMGPTGPVFGVMPPHVSPDNFELAPHNPQQKSPSNHLQNESVPNHLQFNVGMSPMLGSRGSPRMPLGAMSSAPLSYFPASSQHFFHQQMPPQVGMQPHGQQQAVPQSFLSPHTDGRGMQLMPSPQLPMQVIFPSVQAPGMVGGDGSAPAGGDAASPDAMHEGKRVSISAVAKSGRRPLICCDICSKRFLGNQRLVWHRLIKQEDTKARMCDVCGGPYDAKEAEDFDRRR
jgi:hypothetical protein